MPQLWKSGKSRTIKVIIFYNKLQVSQKKNLRKRNEDKEKKNDKDTTTIAHKGDVYIIYDYNYVNLACQNSTWIINSSTSYHVNLTRDLFLSYTVGVFGTIIMRNKGVCEIVGV